MIARLPGTIAAAATPFNARAAIIVPGVGASATASEARTKSAIPAMKTRPTPNRSPAAPPTRISAESGRR